ncbi:glycosyltransferase [Herbivorax sp. ANBcel31]|uniref:glycosyltransferase n=1 Tax=Herbivorax sp. ANBcel31 TaxID=3069754 RepID=UPI0027B1B4EE|nr:glycosyltransferase [Herbivorax sp. ANBcel31]MDQ2085664.1 glycosyltransferase [Herbivorax sp. ANBcel31]
MEKYSVLMSLYIKENPSYLRQSIDSMINQTIMPDEIVLVKDGPLTPELEEVIEEYLLKHPNLLNIVPSEVNIGLGLALNLGLSYCRNELIARMDTDDISLPDRCEKQLQYFAKDEQLSILSGSISEFIDDQRNVVGRRILPIDNIDILKYIKRRCPINHMAVMFKKSEVIKAGGYQDWFWNEDYYLWIRMYENGCKFGNLEDVLVNVRVGLDMYKRRGGIKYFKSEAKLQKYMLDKKIINMGLYVYNVGVRFILQVLMPSSVRGVVFRLFARGKI